LRVRGTREGGEITVSGDKPSLFSPGVGKRGMTDLHHAAYAGDIEGLRRALLAGLDVNAADSYRGYTPLHWLADMAATGGPRLEMLELLIRSGADINAPALDGTTALVLAREAGSACGDELAAVLEKLARTSNAR
jgi:Ankyrin repeats (3 copies)